jgi:hypothetical protein
MKQNEHTRRKFLQMTTAASGAAILSSFCKSDDIFSGDKNSAVPVYAHLWVYASRFPPDWDCTPIMDEVFSELKYAGLQGVEVMEVHLRQKDAVDRFRNLTARYALPVTVRRIMRICGTRQNMQKLQTILNWLQNDCRPLAEP